MAVKTVLIIEYEDDLRQLLRSLLERESFAVAEVSDGRQGIRQFHRMRHDLAVLDEALPDLDGWQVLERIRDMSDVPVLMLTVLASDRVKARARNGGADDYLTKPFGSVEFIARLEALSRQLASNEVMAAFDDGTLHVDFVQQEVTMDGKAVNLTPTEYHLLVALVQNLGRVPSSEELIGLTDELIRRTLDDSTRLAGSKSAVVELQRKLGWDGSGESEAR